jgi:hypothetical protein
MRRSYGIISKAQWQQDTSASIVATFALCDFGRSVSAALLGRLIVMAACVRTSLSQRFLRAYSLASRWRLPHFSPSVLPFHPQLSLIKHGVIKVA